MVYERCNELSRSGKRLSPNWAQFLDWFADENACARYLEELRWPDGFVCLACGVKGDPYRASRSRLLCRACHTQWSVTSGTIFDGTRTPLTTWFAAIWYMTNQKNGVSALGLKESPWLWELSDSMDNSSQTKKGDGSPRSRKTFW